MEENLLLQKDLSKRWKTKFLSESQLLQKMFILMCYMILLINTITVHKTAKMKPVDATSNFYAEYNEDSNEKDPKFKVADRIGISRYKKTALKKFLS